MTLSDTQKPTSRIGQSFIVSSLALELMPTPFVLFDLVKRDGKPYDMVICGFNKAFETLVGESAQIGKGIREVGLEPENVMFWMDKLYEAFNSVTTVRWTNHRFSSGEVFSMILAFSVVPTNDVSSKRVGVVFIKRRCDKEDYCEKSKSTGVALAPDTVALAERNGVDINEAVLALLKQIASESRASAS